MQHMKFIAWNK